MSARVVLVRNGARESCAPDAARVPLLSGAARYGEGALEVLTSGSAGVYLAHRHFKRLQASCHVLGLEAPSFPDLLEDLEVLGPGAWRLRWTVCDDGTGATMRWLHGEALERACGPARCLAVQGRPSALGTAKTTSYAFARTALRQARAAGLNDALAFEGEGLLEGATSNVWMVREGVVYAPMGESILPGITRHRLVELARDLHMEVREPAVGELALQDVRQADELWLSSSVRGLRRVEELVLANDVLRFGEGPFFTKLLDAYEADREEDWGDGRLVHVPSAHLHERLSAQGFVLGDGGWHEGPWELGVAQRGDTSALFWRSTFPGGGGRLRVLAETLGSFDSGS